MAPKLRQTISPKITPRGIATSGQSNSRDKNEEIQSVKRAKISRSSAEKIDNNGFELVESNKQTKQRKKGDR